MHRKRFIIIITMAHPVVVDDELGASPFFLRSLWLTMNNQNSERHVICCDRQQVFHDCGEMWKPAMSRLMTSL